MTQALPAQGYPQTAQTPAQQQFQKPAFQGSVAIFPAEPGRKYQYSGNVSFPAAELQALFQYLQTKQPDRYGNIQLRMVGFNNQSKQGQPYIGGYVGPKQDQPQQPYPQMGQQAVAPQWQNPAPAPAPVMQPAPTPTAPPATTQTPPTWDAAQQGGVPF